jgi:LysR family transcriptional activator of nhaA
MKNNSLNYNHLFYFHTVASEGSLAKAAKRLSVTQSSISEQLRILEAALGKALFSRAGGRLRLNEAGNAVFEQTQQMFRAGERIQRLFGSNPEATRTRLTIGASSTVSRLFAAKYFTPLFREEDLHIRFRHGDYDLLLHEILRGELDIILSENRPADPQALGMDCVEIVCPDLVLVASPQLASTFKTFPDDIDGLKFLHYTPHSRYRWELDAYFERVGVEPFILAEVDDVQIMHEAAEQGVAACIVPRSAAITALEEERLVELGSADLNKPCIYALYRGEKPADHITRAIELMRSETRQSMLGLEKLAESHRHGGLPVSPS